MAYEPIGIIRRGGREGHTVEHSEREGTYESLMGEAQWRRLHPDIQQRFSSRAAHQAVTYAGKMEQVHMSKAGWLLAQICRLIGTPLALHAENNVPISVRVYPNQKLGGMTWDRFYYFRKKGVNRVKSTKVILAQQGLVEIVGAGFGMRLKAREEKGALIFESTEYFWRWGNKIRFSIPHLLSPGKTTVKQQALPEGRFRFSLAVIHPILNKVFWQTGIFKAER